MFCDFLKKFKKTKGESNLEEKIKRKKEGWEIAKSSIRSNWIVNL